MKNRIYLDHAAATPVDPRVKEVMLPFLSEKFGNPSSLHQEGRDTKQVIEEARSLIAKSLNAQTEEIIFTSSGTESCNLAIFGVTTAKGKGHVITTAAEHHAVLEPFEALERQGWEVTFLPVNEYGLVNAKDVADAVREDTVLVSIIFANNEVGSINPVKEITKAVKRKNASTMVHTDACQAFGYLKLDVKSLGLDLLTVNASKIYGPKGAGALYVKKGTELRPLVYGGGQEKGRRSGTENVAAIVGFGEAVRLNDVEEQALHVTPLRDHMIEQILSKVPDASLNGHPSERLPNNVNVSISGVEGETLVIYLDKKGIACSTAAACTTASTEPSHVLLAMGKTKEEALSTLRFSLGRSTTKEDIDEAVEKLAESVSILKK